VEKNENILKPDHDKQQEERRQQNESIKDSTVIENKDRGNNNRQLSQQDITRFKIKRGLKIKMDCEFCKGPISASPHVYKFANYERFFCCKGCMSGYKQKYAGRIESIKRRFEKRED
jgi:hypothetical protein